jgi:hypothetical protein
MSTATVVATLTAGPFGQLVYAAGGSGGYQLVATAGGPQNGVSAPIGSGVASYPLGASTLNVAGMAAVASAVNTYLGALSAAKKAQLPNGQNACPYVVISSGEVNVPVHQADVATFGATLAAVLNTSGNYGPVGT